MSKIIDEFHRLFYHGPSGVEPWTTTTWLGAKCEKNPLDAWVYQEILYETKPEVIVETGVRFGGSVLYWASLCDVMNKGLVVGVDVTLKDVHTSVFNHPRIRLIMGDSVDPAVLAWVHKMTDGKRTMVVLDSAHDREHVLAELWAYGPIVTPGCYMVCEDGNINGHPVVPRFGPGPAEALAEFLTQSHGWEVDRARERLLVTFNPGGFLRRVG